jgi:DNA-binding transcriptional LysR family regulator
VDINAVDLNLLVVFDAMVTHRSVTRAGQALALIQPAMSAAVARLRALLDDPLFVRSGAEMKPTPRALELATPIRRVIELVKTDVLQRSRFDPAVTTRVFTIVTPDIGEINFLPKLIERFAREAPMARLRTIAEPRTAAARALESGDAELAVGYFPDLRRAGFFQQKLFDNRHVCLIRSDHPTIGRRLSLKDYLAASHAIVRPEGREHVFEQFMQQKGLQRHVLVELSHFMSLLPVLERSDLIATVPLDLASVCVRYGTLRLVDAPVKSPAIAVHQFWHTLFHKDPANIWLRGLIRSLFLRGEPASVER